ncbi:RNA helicase [Ceratobasidium sp. 423]|nr:RNA helicase [Ceratobasidium sp. 423]
MTRNIPKLKEQNYTQWKSAIAHSIKATKLWGYIDGSTEEPSQENASEWMKYMSEASAVRSAILGSLEPGAQRHIEEALAPREAWLTLEKQYLMSGNDDHPTAIEKQLVDLRLEEEGDVAEHLVAFCRLRRCLHGSRFELDDQTSIEMLYRSLPPNYRQLILTPERTEMKDFSALCARLRDPGLGKIPDTQDQPTDTSSPPAKDHTYWGVPDDIKAFGLTGDKNPLLDERAVYEWRRELWGAASINTPEIGDPAQSAPSETPMAIGMMRLNYEFSEPVKVVLDFDELGLRQELKNGLHSQYSKPSAIQQCVILPIIGGRNILAQAPRGNGKTAALAISTLQIIDPLPYVQALIFTPTDKAAAFQEIVEKLRPSLSSRCYSHDPLHVRQTKFANLAQVNRHHIVAGTPDYVLGLIRRNILKTHNLKLLVLDDVDELIETGFEEQILEAYRQIPPLAQIVATSLSSSIVNAVTKFLVDPLRISVNSVEGVPTSAQHFFVKVPVGLKSTVLQALTSKLGSDNIVILCRRVDEISIQDPSRRKDNIRRLEQTTRSPDRRNLTRQFKESSRATLATTDSEAAFPTDELSDSSATLIIYNIPSDTEGYIKLITKWRGTHTGQDQSIITFVTSDTDEIHAIRDLERHQGVEVLELLWDGKSLC